MLRVGRLEVIEAEGGWVPLLLDSKFCHTYFEGFKILKNILLTPYLDFLERNETNVASHCKKLRKD